MSFKEEQTQQDWKSDQNILKLLLRSYFLLLVFKISVSQPQTFIRSCVIGATEIADLVIVRMMEVKIQNLVALGF